MSRLSRISTIVALLWVGSAVPGRADSLESERMLHPVDSFTAYTFGRGEWSYNVPVGPVPVGWLWWGATDWMTVEIDAEAWLGAVPSVNARFALRDQAGFVPGAAYETMVQYLPRDINLLEDYEYLDVTRRGLSVFHRVNLSWKIGRAFRVHASLGATYSESLEIANAGRRNEKGRAYRDLIAPDASLAIDWRPLDRLSVHAAASYGTTFVYLDNVPKKRQLATGVRLAPFVRHDFWLWRNLRAELTWLFIHFAEADEWLVGPLPYIYWQWGGPPINRGG